MQSGSSGCAENPADGRVDLFLRVVTRPRRPTRARNRTLRTDDEHEDNDEDVPDTRNSSSLCETSPLMSALSSPKPNRTKRLALRFAILMAVVALGGTYLLSPPPELIMWTSLPLGNTSKRVRVLVPNGWIAS